MTRTSVATDAFTGVDGTDIAGANWTKLRDVTFGSTAKITSNKATGYFANASAGDTTTQTHTVQMVRAAGTYSNDQYAKTTLGGLGPNAGPDKRGGVLVRASTDTDATADFYALYVCDDDTGVIGSTTVLCKVVNGTFTSLDSRRLTWANGDTVALEVAGTTLTPYKNGTALGYTVSDSALTTGRPGFYIASESTNSPSVLSLDDWDGGNVTASAIDLVATNSTQANASSTGAVQLGVFTAAANSSQANASAAVAIGLRIPLTGANASQANASSTGTVSVGQQFVAATSTQPNSSSAVLISVGGTLVSVPLVNNTNTLLANLPVTVYVHDVVTGALRVKKTGISTDATGKWSFSDAAIAKSGPHRCVTVFGDGAEGLDTYNGF